ncbi:MAG: hypothetical protein AAB361_00120 [Patescibacteria group bacterium]
MKRDREKLIRYFQEMKSLEESTRDYYIKIARDPILKDQEIKNAFETISKEEQKHANIVAKIIILIKNNI